MNLVVNVVSRTNPWWQRPAVMRVHDAENRDPQDLPQPVPRASRSPHPPIEHASLVSASLDSMSERLGRISSNAFTVSVDKHWRASNTVDHAYYIFVRSTHESFSPGPLWLTRRPCWQLSLKYSNSATELLGDSVVQLVRARQAIYQVVGSSPALSHCHFFLGTRPTCRVSDFVHLECFATRARRRRRRNLHGRSGDQRWC